MNFDAILTAFINVLTPLNLIGLIFGVAVGIIIGALPGLSVNMGIALLFPLTFSFQGIGGILMLLGVYCGAIYGGSISAILLKKKPHISNASSHGDMPESETDLLRSKLPDSPDMLHRNQEPEPARKQPPTWQSSRRHLPEWPVWNTPVPES